MATTDEAFAKIERDRIVDNHTYTDPAVFEAEAQRIFGGIWNFVCHESELRDPGSFVTTVIAGEPVLVVRDSSGTLRAFYNTCRHRGSLVALDERGSCSAFRCPYHSWVYSLEGELKSIPGEDAYDGTGFHKESFPLVGVACEEILGLVFVHLGDDPVALSDWLGPEVVETLRRPLANADLEVVRRTSNEIPVNWKVWAENIRDGYHVPFVHPFFRKASPPGHYHLHRNGHAVQELGMDPQGMEPELWEQLRQVPFPGIEVGEGYIVNVFPDLAITLRSNVVSIDSQRALSASSVMLDNRTLGLVGDGPEEQALRMTSQRAWFNDPVWDEDVPVFLAQQQGVQSRKVRYSVIARGAHAMTGTRGDDNRLRHFWVEWRHRMGVTANSLDADVPGR